MILRLPYSQYGQELKCQCNDVETSGIRRKTKKNGVKKSNSLKNLNQFDLDNNFAYDTIP